MANEDIFQLGIKAIIRNDQGQILLLQVNPKMLKGNDKGTYWDIPGGRIHKESSVKETLQREVEEETGIKNISNIKLFAGTLSNIRIPVNEGSVGLILFAYNCNVDSKEQIKISDEHLKYKWFSPREASRLLAIKYPKDFTEKIAIL